MADIKTPSSQLWRWFEGGLLENDFARRIFRSGQKMKPLQVRQTLQGHDHLTNSNLVIRLSSGDTEMIPQHSRACPLRGGQHETR